MSKCQGKRARKMVYPREDKTFLLGVLLAGADGVSCWATLTQRAWVSRDDQCQRYFIVYLHKFCYTDSISYDLYNFAGQLRGRLRTSLVHLSTHLVWVRTPLDMRRSSLRAPLGTRRSLLRTHLRCREGDGLGRTTTLLLLRSLQIQSLDQLLNKSVRGNHFIYSQSIMVIHANTNCYTHLSCLQLMGGHHVLGHIPSKVGQCYLR
jgi:hypothetical protein